MASHDVRLVIAVIAWKARSRIPEHQAEGQISIQTVAGHIQVRAQGRSFELRTGGVLALDQGLRHDVEAVEESAFLLTIAPRRAAHGNHACLAAG